MTHGKKSKTIYTDLKYNRYMTDDRNRNHMEKHYYYKINKDISKIRYLYYMSDIDVVVE